MPDLISFPSVTVEVPSIPNVNIEALSMGVDVPSSRVWTRDWVR